MKKILSRSLIVVMGLAMVMACGKLPDERLMEKGKKFEEDEKFSEAIASYEKLVKVHPGSPLTAEALYRAGLVYMNGLQNFPKAIKTLQRVIDEYPESKSAAPCQFMIGFIHANNTSDTLKARLAYNTFLQKYPDHELAASVKWELQYLGKDINEIPELMDLNSKSKLEEVEER